MSAHTAPLWRGPLFSPGDRFPLRPPRVIMDRCQEGSSGTGSLLVNGTLPSAEADTGDALAELARFFAVAAASTQMRPMFSTCIDLAWHALLIAPDSYAHFSWQACGQVPAKPWALRCSSRPCPVDHGVGSRSQIRIEATSTVRRRCTRVCRSGLPLLGTA